MSKFPVLPSARRPVGRRSPLLLARRSAIAGLLTLGVFVSLGTAVAVAGDPPDAPVGPSSPGAPAPAVPPASSCDGPAVPAAAAPSPRAASVEVEVRALERVLAGLRRARTDLRAGRPEPMPADEAARQARQTELRALREVLRYEGTRAKTLAALAKAVDAKDEAKASEARATLETLDGTFVAALERIEAGAKSADAKEPRTVKVPAPKATDPKAGAVAGDGAKPNDPKAGDARPGDAPPAPRKRARAPGATGPAKEKPAGSTSGDGKMGSADDDEEEDDLLDDVLDAADDLGE